MSENIRESAKRKRNWNRTERKKIVLSYLKTHPCIDCGETNPIVLDFDHRNPKEKIRTIASMVTGGYALSALMAEIEKCDICCANCHRIRHARDKKVFITPYSPVVFSEESREKIRQSKLGKPRSSDTKMKLSKIRMGHRDTPVKDLTGETFGLLTVLREGKHKRFFKDGRVMGSRVYWWCQCSCGSPEKEIMGCKLVCGVTKSCGCLRKKFYGNQVIKLSNDNQVVDA